MAVMQNLAGPADDGQRMDGGEENILDPFSVKFRRLAAKKIFGGQLIVCQVLHDGDDYSN